MTVLDGQATCTNKAICEFCNKEYGELNLNNHSLNTTHTINEKNATCVEVGYTGDVIYDCCNAIKKSGTVVEKVNHAYDAGKIIKEATINQEGEKIYTCEVCGNTKKELIPKLNETQEENNDDVDKTDEEQDKNEGDSDKTDIEQDKNEGNFDKTDTEQDKSENNLNEADKGQEKDEANSNKIDNEQKDNTQSSSILPNTGNGSMIKYYISIFVLVTLAVYIEIKVK